MAFRKKHKYNAKPTVVDGIKFPSEKEARHWIKLKEMQEAGEISHLTRQVRYTLLPKKGKQKACYYIADFVYLDKDSKWHVVDVKGYRTEVYKLKKKMLYSLLDLEIEEV